MESPLPPPDSDAAAHGTRVADHIGGLIDAEGGAIAFADFMDAALYAPGLGYYSAGSAKFGVAGDFVTAPELSPLFARSLASQFADLRRAHGLAQVLELGGGSGRFAADALVELARLDAVPDRYFLLEVSADLRARQRATLEALAPALIARVEWLDALPVEFEGVVADRARGFFRLRGRVQAELRHRVHDATLHRLQTVADVRQRPVENHVHRVIEVRLLGEFAERSLFGRVEIQLYG